MKRHRPIAVSACIAVIITTGFATRSWIPCAIEAVFMIIASYCWIKFGIGLPWRAKEIRHKHTYVYYGCADHTKKNLERLFLGELRKKRIPNSHGYFEEEEYREGMFRIDIITDELVIGAEYYGDVSISEEDSTISVTTLKRVK